MQRPNPETVTLEDVLITQELSRRSPRSPNWQAEAQAMRSLARQLVHEPKAMLQSLVDLAVELCNAGTAGVSLLETNPAGEQVFRWVVLAGTLADRVGGCIPRHFSPCGVCLDLGTPVLFAYPERYFTYFQKANMPIREAIPTGIVEGLVLPLIAEGQDLGTIWIMSHEQNRQFDPEDVRLMTGLADFTAAALLQNQRHTEELLAANAALETEVGERKQAEKRTYALIANLPGGATFVVDRDLRYLLAEGEALSVAGFKSENFVGKTIFEALPSELAANYEPMYRQALAGEPFEQEHHTHFRTYISRGTPLRAENGQIYGVLVVSYDITDRKRREANAAFLAEIAEDFSRLSTADEIMQAVGAKVGTYLNITNCLFAEINEGQNQAIVEYTWHTSDTPDVTGVYRLSDFITEEFRQAGRAGETIIIRDTQTDPRVDSDRYAALKIHSYVTVPFHREGEWKYLFTVNDSVHRNWREDEIELICEVTNRTFPRLERAYAEQALRESEEKYRSLFNSIDEGFHIIELIDDEVGEVVDYRFLEGNPALERLTGIKNAAGKLGSAIAPKTESYWLEAYDRVARTGEPLRIENYNEDTERWYSAYASRVGGAGSRQIAIIFDDITDRKQAEITLRENEARQAYLLRMSDALRSLADPVEIQETVTRTARNHFGADRCYYCEIEDGNAIVRRDAASKDLPSVAGVYPLNSFAILQAVIDAGRPFVVRDVHTTDMVDEELRQLCIQLQVISYIDVPVIKNGKAVGVLCLVQSVPRDWTDLEVELAIETADRTWAAVERTRAEAALRESEIQRIREQAACEEERQRAEALAEFDRAKTLFFSNVSHEFRTPLTLMLAPLQDALSDRTHPLAPIQQERLEFVHRNSLRLLKLVNTLLDFSRIEAGRMEAVYEPTDLATFTTELASMFRSAIERAGLQLIVDCPPLPEPVYVDREMWEKIVLNLLSNALKFTFEGEIKVSLHQGFEFSVLSSQLGEDASTQNSKLKTQNSKLKTQNSKFAVLQIQDTGTGIASEHLPHLFERFYQVRGTQARTHEGSGIGLALVYELVKLQGGTIEVSSKLGEGTCFTIALPFGKDHLLSDLVASVQDNPLGDRVQPPRTLASTAMGADVYVQEAERWLPASLDPPRPTLKRGENSIKVPLAKGDLGGSPRLVLVVDDNADMQEYLTRILSEHFQVEAVADGATALAATQERVPDLILSDVMMPELDGYELLASLRSNPRTKEIPIILLSARAGVEAIVEGLQAGADDYLIKPFSAQELVSRVNTHLQIAQLRGEALQEARSTIRNKDEFISVVSHELNTPLVSILGWTRLLRSNPSSPIVLDKALDTIEHNAMLQAKLVQDLLDISRISVGKFRLNLEPVELKSIVETAIATVDRTGAEKGVNLVWQQATTDPDNNSIVVMGDRDRLGQVICNLLTNAIKFTPASGNVTIELSVINDHNFPNSVCTQICVSDTGIGIASDFLPLVFDRFRQARELDSSKGLGLGLAIARHIVELHHGTIHAESAGVGKGATFIVRLPIHQPKPIIPIIKSSIPHESI